MLGEIVMKARTLFSAFVISRAGSTVWLQSKAGLDGTPVKDQNVKGLQMIRDLINEFISVDKTDMELFKLELIKWQTEIDEHLKGIPF